jgi:hypothetical protein
MAQQTAVNWLINRFNYIRCIYADDMEDGQSIESAIKIAREMEKEQICEAWKNGNLPTNLGRVITEEEYYNEKYNNEKDN